MTTNNQPNNWYEPKYPDHITSPAMLIYPERIEENIRHIIKIAGNVERLRPHVKTHKMSEVIGLHQSVGINKFKCATIAEAEMLADCGVPDILLAYQPVGPNQSRLITLAQKYPELQFGCLVDNEAVLRHLSAQIGGTGLTLNVWIDIDNGNGRTGIQPGIGAEKLAKLITDTPDLVFAGLHVYDGQFTGLVIEKRKVLADKAFTPVRTMVGNLYANGVEVPNIVAGGSPTFPIHAQRSGVDLSPGTYSLWDMGYTNACPDLPFLFAAVLITRVVSQPGPNRLCLDLGCKAVSADNPLESRVHFLNAPNAKNVDQKEEHLVIELPEDHGFEIGDVLYGIPGHVCPTVALHQEVNVINGSRELVEQWLVVARTRRITV
jgi:D-serine deaminase-like pyridoxal phosphate-dependent protein